LQHWHQLRIQVSRPEEKLKKYRELISEIKRLTKIESKAWPGPGDFSCCQRHYTLSKTAAPFDYYRSIGAPYDPESPPAEL
jgi:hypothetical protein